MRGIVQDHVCGRQQRTGFEVADITLAVNGHVLVASAGEIVAFQLAVAKGERDIDDIARWLRRKAEKVKNGGGSIMTMEFAPDGTRVTKELLDRLVDESWERNREAMRRLAYL